jgi:hypothetical protein
MSISNKGYLDGYQSFLSPATLSMFLEVGRSNIDIECIIHK